MEDRKSIGGWITVVVLFLLAGPLSGPTLVVITSFLAIFNIPAGPAELLFVRVAIVYLIFYALLSNKTIWNWIKKVTGLPDRPAVSMALLFRRAFTDYLSRPEGTNRVQFLAFSSYVTSLGLFPIYEGFELIKVSSARWEVVAGSISIVVGIGACSVGLLLITFEITPIHSFISSWFERIAAANQDKKALKVVKCNYCNAKYLARRKHISAAKKSAEGSIPCEICGRPAHITDEKVG